MFDGLDQLADAGLLAAMSDALRAERAADGRRLVAAGLLAKRKVIDADPQNRWCVDDWEAVAIEIGTELGISRQRASVEMSAGRTLVERFPRLAEVFLAGDLDGRVFAVIDWRTALVTDPAIWAGLDAVFAERAPGWNAKSHEKLVALVDWLVIEYDPEALRVARGRDADRHVEIGPGQDGMADLWGSLPAADGAALDARLEGLAATVCGHDSRTNKQRRADALIALGEGASTLNCDCGGDDCPAPATSKGNPSRIVINVIAEEATVTGKSNTPGYLPGYGVIPAEIVAELAAEATVCTLTRPDDFTVEPQYRPSAALARFIACRDLTCRWPGCEVPARRCDIDHTIPWPHGPTHPSNTKLYCRTHHLLKTFYTGAGGWSEIQTPDATITWTAPTGRTYTTTPAGSLFFPQLAEPTNTQILPDRPPSDSGFKTLMMPTRRRTRASERATRIASERAINTARYAADPPPF